MLSANVYTFLRVAISVHTCIPSVSISDGLYLVVVTLILITVLTLPFVLYFQFQY